MEDTRNDKRTREKQREITPIMDGDARPDQVIEPDFSDTGKERKDNDKNEVTTSRSADVNNLEDYKDAK